jgi:hypothetical protein
MRCTVPYVITQQNIANKNNSHSKVPSGPKSVLSYPVGLKVGVKIFTSRVEVTGNVPVLKKSGSASMKKNPGPIGF